MKPPRSYNKSNPIEQKNNSLGNIDFQSLSLISQKYRCYILCRPAFSSSTRECTNNRTFFFYKRRNWLHMFKYLWFETKLTAWSIRHLGYFILKMFRGLFLAISTWENNYNITRTIDGFCSQTRKSLYAARMCVLRQQRQTKGIEKKERNFKEKSRVQQRKMSLDIAWIK